MPRASQRARHQARAAGEGLHELGLSELQTLTIPGLLKALETVLREVERRLAAGELAGDEPVHEILSRLEQTSWVAWRTLWPSPPR